MSDTRTLSLGSRLRGASSALAKFQSIPPVLTLPAVGLVAWFATPYAIALAEGRGGSVDKPINVGGTGGTTTVPRVDPVAHTLDPAPVTPSSKEPPASNLANVLNRPVTASMIPSWLPLQVPASTPAPQPVAPRKTVPSRKAVQHPVAPAPPKATARLVAPMPRQRLVDHSAPRNGVIEHRSVATSTPGIRNNPQIDRRPAVSNSGSPQWHTNGPVVRAPFGGSPSFSGNHGFGGYRPSFGGFNSMHGGGGGFRGGHH